MLKSRYWVRVVSTPVLLASVGCSMDLRPNSNANRGIPPERMMAMAQTFERQGHLQQAKSAYLQVLAARPDYPNARESLDIVIAAEMKKNRGGGGGAGSQPSQFASRANPNVDAAKLAALAAEQARLASLTSAESQPPARATRPAQRKLAEPVSVTQTQPATESQPVAESQQVAQSQPVTESIPELESVSPSPQIATNEIQPFDDESKADSIPELLTSTDSNEPLVRIGVPAPELDEFVEPLIDVAQVDYREFNDFFGDFHIGMVQSLKAKREQFQPKLEELAGDHHSGVDSRSRAIFLLGSLGSDAADSLPILRRQLHDDEDRFLKIDLAEAILKIQPEDVDAIQELLTCLKDSDQNVRWVAAFALRSAVSPRTTFVIEPLCRALNTDDHKLRRMVFLTLAEFGPAAAVALPELEAALQSPDSATREVAKASLRSIAPDRRTSNNVRTNPERLSVATTR